MVGVAAVTLSLGLGVVVAGQAVETEVRVAAAADSAALAAADAVTGHVLAQPCELAAQVVQASELTLESCEIDSAIGQVRVIVSGQTIFGRVHSRARAGPGVA